MKFEVSSIQFEDILRFDDIPHSKFIYIGRKRVEIEKGQSRYEYWIWDSGFSPEPTVYWSAKGVLCLLRESIRRDSSLVHYASKKVLKGAFKMLQLAD